MSTLPSRLLTAPWDVLVCLCADETDSVSTDSVDPDPEPYGNPACVLLQMLQKRLGAPLATVQTLMQKDKVLWERGILSTPPVREPSRTRRFAVLTLPMNYHHNRHPQSAPTPETPRKALEPSISHGCGRACMCKSSCSRRQAQLYSLRVIHGTTLPAAAVWSQKRAVPVQNVVRAIPFAFIPHSTGAALCTR